MVNGESTHAGTECNFQVELPRNLKRIQTTFTVNEDVVHSVRFEGASVLEIGLFDTENSGDGNKKGRNETFVLKSGETLIGCEIYMEQNIPRGIRWLTWQQPTAEVTDV